MRDYLNVIKNDLDWYFENASIEKLEINKTINEEWDFVLKIKLGSSFGHPVQESEPKFSTHRIKPSGVWPQNVIADVNHVREEHSIQPHMVVGSALSMKLDEDIPFTRVTWRDTLLNNKLVEDIIEDTLMIQNQAILHDKKKSIIIESIILQEEVG